MKLPTDDEIVAKAKELFPYDNENDNRINKLSSKRRRFIQGRNGCVAL